MKSGVTKAVLFGPSTNAKNRGSLQKKKEKYSRKA